MEKKHSALLKIDRVIYRCMWAVSILSGICLIITAFLCTGDVLASKIFNTSIPNGTEWVTYLNIPVVFFAIAYIQMDRGHTVVDLIYRKFPKGMQKVIKLAGDVLGTAVCFFSGYCAFNLTANKLSSHAKSSSASNAFSIWPFVLVIAIGFVLVGIAYAWCIIRDSILFDVLQKGSESEVEA